MKRKLLGLLLAVPLSAGSLAQGQEKEVALEDLQVPNSPAFVLVDASPTSIERPASTRAFAVGIINALNENNGIPRNYGAEVTPFWLTKHPELSALKFWGIDPATKADLPFSGLSRYAISFAFVNRTADSLSRPAGSSVSLGIRTTLVNIRGESDKQALIAANDRLVARLRLQSRPLLKLNTEIALLRNKLGESPDSTAAQQRMQLQLEVLEGRLDSLLDVMSTDKESGEIEGLIRGIVARRPVLAVEVAAATSLAVENNNFSTSRLGRLGGWVNVAYALSLNGEDAPVKEDYINAIAIVRYLRDRNDRDSTGTSLIQGLMDIGGRLEVELGRLSVSFEYLYRWSSVETSRNTFRSSGSLRFKIAEGLYLTGAFGRNFGGVNNLISQFGVNWGISSGNEKVQIQ